MSRREKIIVGLMVAAILYGGYNFLFSGSAGGKKKSYGKPQVAVNEFVAGLIKRFREADTTKTDAEIMEKSFAAWQKDPFLVVPKEKDSAEIPEKEPEIIARAVSTGAFNYSGYMEMGKSRLAIINGIEYQEGDLLDVQGTALKKILPGEAHIYVDTEQGVIVVPLDDSAKP
ncbi:MAG: hypothetical protein GY697_00090 [Desulfobacterales bacterium]|nr:hypothetical protein [Desulfobacterales bacterium]